MAKFVVTCTKYNKAYLSELAGKTQTPVFCVYHGINLDYFFSNNRETKCKPPYKIITVARMTQKKGLEEVYRALAVLRDKGFKFQHFLIGQGDDHPKILALIKKLKLENLTELCGTLTHEQVIGHYASSDLFVLGCKIADNGDRDGIPNVMAESMAMNLPVVATNVSGIPEFLEDRVTGLMVPQKDPLALANAMEILLTDNNLRQQVTREAKKRVTKNFNNKKLIMDLAGIYRKMITGLELDKIRSKNQN